MNKELDAFIDYLDAERDHVLGILEELSEDDLRRPVLPSGWSCLELVRHLCSPWVCRASTFMIYDTPETLWAADTGASLADLMARMGHSSVRAAVVYQHASARRDRGIADALSVGIAEERDRGM